MFSSLGRRHSNDSSAAAAVCLISPTAGQVLPAGVVPTRRWRLEMHGLFGQGATHSHRRSLANPRIFVRLNARLNPLAVGTSCAFAAPRARWFSASRRAA